MIIFRCFQVTTVCASAYAASLMTMLGTCYLLSKTSLSPNHVHNSLNTIYSSVRATGGMPAPCEVDSPLDFESDEVTPLAGGLQQLDAVSSLVAASLSAVDNDIQVQ